MEQLFYLLIPLGLCLFFLGIKNTGYRTKRVGFIGDGASKLLAPSLF